ncbi:ABC transporter permease [Streptomyces sp. ISL-99]|uniref:FtsX-like permease family protein n=1 Tax=Streptomyces sp. ISL-99 TaxID=2819193 RepID=UPI001BE9846E|nr:FtsX-like permease family protein [Streptomyces sp. ISL-99]MBT2527731.1 ABC transporter permease [Streptomyces sp. ISL-99]
MTKLLDRRTGTPPAPATAPTGLAAWVRDLGLGIRFAVSGGRESWARTILTAVGVGLGVALLLCAASVPSVLDSRSARQEARTPADTSRESRPEASDTTVLWADASTEFRDKYIAGKILRAEGTHPVRPPGVDRLPGPGEMVVSPALKELLASPEGKLLAERLNYRVIGTIADSGLLSPSEIHHYVGSSTLTADNGGRRTTAFGQRLMSEPMNPVLVVVIILMCVVLLVPVAIFIATAVRFGGERRDRRLAALRLVGADIRTTRRIAAGEALFGSLLGLVIGAGVFLAARQVLGGVQVWRVSTFPGDITPVPALAALIALAVPAAAVAVTLAALRSVAIEPLGVVRSNGTRRRRLWWRLVPPVAGMVALIMTGTVDEKTQAVDPYPLAGGAVLVLAGLVLLLPWLVEAVVGRLNGGPVPWQLATRRLQLSSGSAARTVSGITVAVAGAIALQMLFAGIDDDFIDVTGQDPSRAQVSVSAEVANGELATRMITDFRKTKGVKSVVGTVEAIATRPGKAGGDEIQPTSTLTVGDCATLRELARIASCEDGDTFVVHSDDAEQNDRVDRTARIGKAVNLNPYSEDDGSKAVLWTLPESTRKVVAKPDPMGRVHDGIFATPGAVAVPTLPAATTGAQVKIDEGLPDAVEYVRNTAARIDPAMQVFSLREVERNKQYASVQSGLLVGATGTMALIAASMLVSQVEQLRERRRLLSVLVAFGTRRATLGWSVLWQTAVPIILGLALAVVGGLALGAAVLSLIEKSVSDWWVFLPFAGAGGALILAVTLLSLPPLWRLMRPEGLRTE